LLPHRTVLQNVGYGLTIQGMPKSKVSDRAMAWIKQVGLEGYEGHYPGQLSGGMQQRVGLARALATDSEILLMDEAFSALDPLIRTSMQDLLLELQAKLHKTIVFITHDLDEALRLADSLAILKDGFVVQAGDPQDIVMHPADEYIESFVKDINRARVVRARAVMQPVCDHDVLDTQVAADDNLEAVLNALQGDTNGCVGVVQEGETVGVINAQTLLDVLQSPQS
jgi:glycine betaine/proline transport system ATP-binding protein